MIAIVGGSGAGKSWLAEQLQKRMKGNVARLSLDDFYKDRSRLSPLRRAKVNFDHPRAIDWSHLEQTLKNCLAGRRTELPSYDFATHTRKKQPRSFTPRPLIVMEGLWLLRRPSVRRLFHWRIFIDCPSRERLKRRVRRDVLERGRSERNIRQQFHATVAPMHRRYVETQKRWADTLLSHAPSGAEVEMLSRELQALIQ